MTNVAFIQSIPVLNAENSVPTLFLSGRLDPKKGYHTHDLRFGVCGIDLDMQVSFLNRLHHETLIWDRMKRFGSDMIFAVGLALNQVKKLSCLGLKNFTVPLRLLPREVLFAFPGESQLRRFPN